MNGRKHSYRRGTARRAMSVEILSFAAQLYKKLHLKRFTKRSVTLKVTQGD